MFFEVKLEILNELADHISMLFCLKYRSLNRRKSKEFY